jgi:GNAT superfamily N-acetyltransferase
MAEIDVVVSDPWQGRGLAKQMIEWLAELAVAEGIERFVASVLPENEPMLSVFTRGFGALVTESPWSWWVEFSLARPAVHRAAA